MAARGWKRRLAKGREYRQSLLEHGLNGLDVMCRLLPILSRPAHMHLTESEGRILQVAILAHDVGKETDDFQEYLKGQRRSASHIDPERTRQVVPAVCEALGFDDISLDVMRVIEDCINTHHPSPASVLRGIVHGSSRWWVLAQVVMAVDHLCSAADLRDARDELGRGFLKTSVQASYHQLVMRGVSTTLLHQAAQEAFAAAGWTPLLCFTNGTLYVADGSTTAQAPSIDDIAAQLQDTVGSLLSERDLREIVVGSPIASMLPKPELVDFSLVHAYLSVATRRARRGVFIKKSAAERIKVVKRYLEFSSRASEDMTEDLVARESARIDAAQPEGVVFKVFKALTAQELLGHEESGRVCAAYDE